MTPAPSAGGPCDCSTCQSYSDQKSRCLCCVYHGVGGKRSVLDPMASSSTLIPLESLPPSVHFFLVSALAKVRGNKGATLRAKDGGDEASRRWLQTGTTASHPTFQRQDVSSETEFGLEPVLAVKTRSQREALGSSGALEKLRRFLLAEDSV